VKVGKVARSNIVLGGSGEKKKYSKVQEEGRQPKKKNSPLREVHGKISGRVIWN